MPTAPKTKTSRRSVSLDAARVSVLRRRQPAWKLFRGAGYRDSDLVFARPDGRWPDPDAVGHRFAYFVRKLSVKPIRLHDLRHTHASIALAVGVHPKVVQERLGHSSIQITLDRYSHLVPSMQDDAAARIGALINPSRASDDTTTATDHPD